MLVVVVVMVMVIMVMMVVLLPLELLPHVVSILPVRIILGLHIMNLVAKGLRVQIEGRAVALAHVEGHVLGTKHLRSQ